MGADDFDLLTIIGRGAFGEVRLPRHPYRRVQNQRMLSCACHITPPHFLLVHVSGGDSPPADVDRLPYRCAFSFARFNVSTSSRTRLCGAQVRLCREKKTGNIYAMKKLKKSEMLRRGQVLPSELSTSQNPTQYFTSIDITKHCVEWVCVCSSPLITRHN